MLVAWLMTPGMSFLPGGSFDVLPHRPFVLVARIGLLDAVGADLHLQQQVDDVLQRHVEGVRAVPASPADVIARALLGNAAQRMVERVDAKLRPVAVLRLAHRRHHPLVHVGQEGVVDLHIEAGIDDRLVFLVQAVGEREQQRLLVGVVLVLGAGQRARRRHHRQERGVRVGLGRRAL